MKVREAGAGGKEVLMGCQVHMYMEEMDHSGPGEEGGREGKEARSKGERGVVNLDWEDWFWKLVRSYCKMPLRDEVFGPPKHAKKIPKSGGGTSHYLPPPFLKSQAMKHTVLVPRASQQCSRGQSNFPCLLTSGSGLLSLAVLVGSSAPGSQFCLGDLDELVVLVPDRLEGGLALTLGITP